MKSRDQNTSEHFINFIYNLERRYRHLDLMVVVLLPRKCPPASKKQAVQPFT